MITPDEIDAQGDVVIGHKGVTLQLAKWLDGDPAESRRNYNVLIDGSSIGIIQVNHAGHLAEEEFATALDLLMAARAHPRDPSKG